MVDSYHTAERIKSISRTEETPASRYDRWKAEITMAEKELDKFHRQGRNTDRRFRDERDAADQADRKFNIFSANVGILESVLYSNIPKVTVTRRFGRLCVAAPLHRDGGTHPRRDHRPADRRGHAGSGLLRGCRPTGSGDRAHLLGRPALVALPDVARAALGRPPCLHGPGRAGEAVR